MRLASPQDLPGNVYLTPGMTSTVVAPINCAMSWMGVLNDEFRSQPPEKI